MEVDKSDLQKVAEVLGKTVEYFQHMNQMNAALHLSPKTIPSPLTSELELAKLRLERIIKAGEQATPQA